MAKMQVTRRGAALIRTMEPERVPISRERKATALAFFERLLEHMDQRRLREIETVEARRGTGRTKREYEDALAVVGLLEAPLMFFGGSDRGRCLNGLSRDQVTRAIAKLRPARGPNLYRPNWELPCQTP